MREHPHSSYPMSSHSHNFLGIIRNFKVLYRKRVLKHLLSNIDEQENFDPSCITVLDAIMWIRSAMKEVKKQTVTNCFIKAGFSTQNFVPVGNNSEDRMDPLDSQVADYASIDDQLATESSSIDIRDLVEMRHESALEEDENDDETSVQEVPITTNDLEKYASCAKKYFLQNGDAAGLALASDLEMHVQNIVARKPKKQTLIVNYFEKLNHQLF
ncbi:hypothetical protein QAD02_015411 [Eretmocerus hayati]|uniref:Uncharacterized protein n=1 Tax=Eretmocerus hayati TaxID=131215 RepID=A0ACC2PAM5_9HYME|nr:hypothetical protein QAD02_015411 [Eretmocerus hayati]